MHRIDGDGNVANLFTEGDPMIPQVATQVTDDWLNDTQEEICNTVEAAGLTLVKGLRTQLRDAVLALIANTLITWLTAIHTWTALQSFTGGLNAQSVALGGIGADVTSSQGIAVRATSADTVAAGIYAVNVGGGPALEVSDGHAKFSAVNPVSTAAIYRTLGPANFVKAWGKVVTSGAGAVTLLDGGNVKSVAIVGALVRITFADAGPMAHGDYSVALTMDALNSAAPVMLGYYNPTTTKVDVQAFDAAGSAYGMQLNVVGFTFMVLGKQ